jgi:hypothetical protein
MVLVLTRPMQGFLKASPSEADGDGVGPAHLPIRVPGLVHLVGGRQQGGGVAAHTLKMLQVARSAWGGFGGREG